LLLTPFNNSDDFIEVDTGIDGTDGCSGVNFV
jgi:hypothetical protein